MPHCQICLTPLPDHTPNCPVATGEPVPGRTHLVWVQSAPQGPSGQLMGIATSERRWHLERVAPQREATELRIEWLEKEVHKLRARVAKLERE